MSYQRLTNTHDQQRGHSSAVSSLMFHNGGGGQYTETKSGSYVFSGDSAVYHEWEFRTKLRMVGLDGNQYQTAMSKVVKGLRGDVFIIAQEVGIERLMHLGKKTRVWVPTSTEYEDGAE